MQTFEFHFNPKTKPDLIFDSFCFEPANIYEKKVGSLYMTGFLKNVFPQNTRFLDNLAKVIKERYYKFTLKAPEKALKESLKSANEYLEQIAKKGDVSWLGNLSFAALCLKNYELNFTKIGNIKVLLLRKGKIIDIGKSLKFEDLEPYPLRVFPNIVSGKLAENDLLLILTDQVFNSLQNQGLISAIARTAGDGLIDGKQIREILQRKSEELSKIFGTCLIAYLSKEGATRSRQTILPKIKIPAREFSFRSIFAPPIAALKKLLKNPRPTFLNFKKINWPKFPRLRPPLAFPSADWRSKLKFPPKRNLFLILGLAVFLVFGFLVARQEETKKLNSYKATLEQIREKVIKAEDILTFEKGNPAIKKQATNLLNETWQEISPLVKIAQTQPADFQNLVISLRNEISEKLFDLNKMIRIDEPELFTEVETSQIIPQRIISDENAVYLFSPYASRLLKISAEKEKEEIPESEKFHSAVRLNDSVLFFVKPAKISLRDNQGFSETQLSNPSENFNFDQFASFNSNLYFFDRENETIVKYPYLGGFRWGEPQNWLTGSNKIIKADSIAVDGNVWVLNGDNVISRYYAGRIQETLDLDIFPAPKSFSKISLIPSLSYLYILEPSQNRLVVINKSGQIVKQFQSSKFDNLLDFNVAENGKTIYLLNGQKVYQIQN